LKEYYLIEIKDLAADELAVAVSLQGIVNRDNPNIYLGRENGMEMHWVDWYKHYGYEPVISSVDEVLGKFAGKIKGYILYDEDVPDTINVAASLAGLKDAVMCAQSVEEKLRSLGLECLVDLRGKFEGRVEPYQWLIDEYLSDFDLRVMANYDQKDKPRSHPDMDYLIAHRGFCMGLTVNQADYPEEAALWDKVQTVAPNHAIMLGWHNPHDSEATHVYFASRHNVSVFCGYATNSSFHQHIAASEEYKQDHCEHAECDPNGKYAAITLSDGDSWHSMVDVQKKFWLNPRRGEAPVGWEVAPIFAEAGPAVLEYYFKTKTDNDYILCGPSGISYNYPSGIDDLDGYLKISADAMRKCSLRSIWAINRIVRHVPGGGIEHTLKDEKVVYTRQQMEEFGGIKDQKGADIVDDDAIAKYMEAMPDALGFFQGWERIPGEKPHWCDGRIWSPGSSLVRKDIDGAIREFEESASRQSGPVFVCAHVNCYDSDMDVIIETIKRLEEKGFKVVRPDVFLRLAQDAYARGLVK